MRKFVLLLFMAVSVLALSAQEKKVSGRLVDSGTHESVGLATVQLLKNDSTYLCGTVTAADGSFSVVAPRNGAFILKLSSVG